MRTLFVFLICQLMLCANTELKFFGQDLQDQFVYENYFKGKEKGFFVDIGAHEGVFISNTYFFEKYLGWGGICFEPTPASFKKLAKNRKCICINVAVATEAGRQSFVVNPKTKNFINGLLDQFDPNHVIRHGIHKRLRNRSAYTIDVDCITFNDVMEEHGVYKIDFLSIDTEGGELKILQSIDFDRFDIDIICVENLYLDPGFKQFLSKKGYQFIKHGEKDDFFKKCRTDGEDL